ncbi:MAG: Jag N-terminal domain-containing protein [Desulfovibrio sp.]|nr:Jag N-terminal domain-containing protein [Desulfovibrio sp.]
MEGFKEFQGKDLDSAIEEACSYFDSAREKLEIEIVQDSKSGIFGIVGARKAKVRARRVQLREAVDNALGRKGGQTAPVAACAAAVAEAPEKNRNQREENGQPAGGQQEKRTSRSRGRKPAAESGSSSQPEAAQGQEARSGRGAGPRSEKQGDKNAERGVDKNNARNGDSAQDKASDKNSEKAVEKSEAEGRSDRSRGSAPRNAGRSQNPQNGQNGQSSQNGQNGQSNQNGQSGQNGDESRRGEGRARRGEARENRDIRENRSAVKDGGREVARQVKSVDVLDDDFEEAAEGLPAMPMEQLDQGRLETLVRETVRQLVRPIVGDAVQLEVKLGGDRVQVGIDSEEDSGLLIGREGQTLAALQYMISRIVSRGMNAAVRVQLDAGEYRSRQDEKLREMALSLAEKVRLSGRSYSTRPLSSYHRRIVHVCLQEATDVQTRSTGDGPMKRVVILRRKAEKS